MPLRAGELPCSRPVATAPASLATPHPCPERPERGGGDPVAPAGRSLRRSTRAGLSPPDSVLSGEAPR